MNGQKVICIKTAVAKCPKFGNQNKNQQEDSQKSIFYKNCTKNMTGLERARFRATSFSMPNIQILEFGNGHVINQDIGLQLPPATINCASPAPKKWIPTLGASDFSCISLVDEELPDHFDNDQAFLCDFLEHNKDETVTMATTTHYCRKSSGHQHHHDGGPVQKMQNDQRLMGNTEVHDDDDESSTSNLHNSLNFFPQECRLVDPVAWTLNCRVFVPIVS